ncbi:MAG: hydrogenase maturation protease, partial [Candidatus Humimicrobiaceae bacterium]
MKNLKNIKTVVMGIGNILLGDEGIGVHTVKKLQEESLPSSVLVIDGSTAGFRLFPVFETYKKCRFIIIDAMKIPNTASSKTSGSILDNRDKKSNSHKGDLYLIPLSDFYNIASPKYPGRDFVSFHQTALIDVLNLFYLTYRKKIDGYLIGVNIYKNDNTDNTITFSMKLSSTIEGKISEIIGLIKK